MNPQQFNFQNEMKGFTPAGNSKTGKKKSKSFIGIIIISIGLGILFGNILINIYYSFNLDFISINLYSNKIAAIVVLILFFILLFFSISSFTRFKQNYVPTSKIIMFLIKILALITVIIISLITGTVIGFAFGAIMNSSIPHLFFPDKDIYVNFTVWSAIFTIAFFTITFIWLLRKGVRSFKMVPNKEDSYERLQSLSNAINQNPNIALNYNDRGAIYSSMKNYDRALEDFNKAIEIDSDFAVAYSNRAIAFIKKGLHSKAIQDANKAIELKNFGNTYISRGYAYGKLGNIEQAFKDYQTAIDLDSSLMPYVTKCRGETYFDMGKYNLAVMDFETTLSRVSDYKEELTPMLNEAKLRLKTAVQEGSSSDFEQKIISYLQSGDKVQAIKHYREISGLSLKESREKVEEIEMKLKIK